MNVILNAKFVFLLTSFLFLSAMAAATAGSTVVARDVTIIRGTDKRVLYLPRTP